jgi:hypothetical protein
VDSNLNDRRHGAKVAGWAEWGLAAALLLWLFLVTVHLVPRMPSAGLDPSWIQAANAASADGFRYGRDFVFSYGPYAPVVTHVYHPEMRALTLLGGVLLWAGIAVATLCLVGRGWRSKLLAVCAVPFLGVLLAFGFVETTFLVVPLFLVLAASSLIEPDGPAAGTRTIWTATIVMCGTLALLPAIKVSSAVPVAFAVVCIGTIAWLAGHRRLAAAVPVTFVIGFSALWLISGQSLAAVPGYVRWSFPISSGYGEAMSVREVGMQSPLATVTYALAATLIGAALAFATRSRSRLLLLAMWSGTALVAFKEGFVRADGHIQLAWPALALGLIMMLRWGLPRAFLVPAFGFALIHVHLVWPPFTVNGVEASLRTAPEQLRAVLAGEASEDHLNRQYRDTLRNLRERHPLPSLRGTVDVYPWEASVVFANGLAWSPRPVVQSYAAYTASLAELNARHVSAPRAATNVVFRFDSIDNRLPALSDGPSWIPLLERYRPNGTATFEGDVRHQLLTRRAKPIELTVQDARHGRASVGQWIPVPKTRSGQALFTKVEMSPTLAGRLRDTLWRPPFVFISVQLSDGRELQHRFLPRLGHAGFVLSPYVDQSNDFSQLYGGKGLPRVTKFKIATDGGRDALFWKQRLDVQTQVVELPAR